ncbi:aminoglycoside phosphotransferase family protein [Pseudonocardia xinjiangensis]|uniref:aminoglycoside phosphotransferase family protein n=1 Tax=Pseudonocardia xinjiangensis TaxID=75289 RepID=UPI003D8E9169
MTGMSVIDETAVAARRARAVAAATAAGRHLGLPVTEPRVLYDVFSVIVHLAPAPVVVRVPTVLPRTVTADPGTQACQQRAELAVAGWLADQGHPVVAPSPLVPREPVRWDGYSMTFWQLVDQVTAQAGAAEPDPQSRAEAATELHAVLRDYPGELSFLVPLDASVPDGIAQLEGRPDLLDPELVGRARHEWALLEPLVTTSEAFAAAFPGLDVQPIHGDAPAYNMISTPDGELCSDFEHTTLGPVEWDLSFTGPDERAAYDAAAERLGLRPLDGRLMRVMERARMLQFVACLPMAHQLPGLLDGLRSMIELWRTTPALAEIL